MSRSRYSLSFAHGSRASHIEGGIGRSGASSRSIPPRRPENGSSWSGATVARGGEFAGVMIFPCSVEKTQAPPLLAIMIRLSWTCEWCHQQSKIPWSVEVFPLCFHHHNAWWISPNSGGSVHEGYWQCRSRAIIARVWFAGKIRFSRPTSRIVDSGPNTTRVSDDPQARVPGKPGETDVPSAKVAGGWPRSLS